MAIQMRRGAYADFDPAAMLPGEWAIVLSGDPNTTDGKAIYHCFVAGAVKRITTAEELASLPQNVYDEVMEALGDDIDAMEQATTAANTAATQATTAATNADAKAQLANNAAANATSAASDASTAAEDASDAADAANTAAQAAIDAAESLADGVMPGLTAGMANALFGETEALVTLPHVIEHSGAARITSIHGNTIVDSGSLLSVNIEGVKPVGFNQWDEEWEVGGIKVDGTDSTTAGFVRSKNYIPVVGGADYYFKFPTEMHVMCYDSEKAFISYISAIKNVVRSLPSNACYIRFRNATANMWTTYNHDICINLSDPLLNGTYKPYRKSTIALPITEYFTGGMKSAGSVYDELTSDKAVTRIGSVDLGTLNWSTLSTPETHIFRTTINDKGIKGASSNSVNGNGITPRYEIMAWSPLSASSNGKFAISTDSSNRLVFVDSDYSTVEAFVAAVTGEMLYYELATPTEAIIDPPLNLAYPTEQGGTESIVIPTGEQSAAPTMAVVYAYNADGVRDISQAIIATIEGNTASANYSVGGYFVHAGRLYKATSAIATGETINPGINCAQTTVMAELVALTA